MHKLKSRIITNRINTKPSCKQTTNHLVQINATRTTTLLAKTKTTPQQQTILQKTIAISILIVPQHVSLKKIVTAPNQATSQI